MYNNNQYGSSKLRLLQEGLYSEFLESEKQKEIQQKTLDELSDEILSIYSNNELDVLFKEKCPSESEVYLLLTLKCDGQFYIKYLKNCEYSSSMLHPQTTKLMELNLNEENISNHNNKHFNRFKTKPTTQEIKSNIQTSQRYKKILKEILDEIVKSNELLIDTILSKYNKRKKEQMKSENEEYYNNCSLLYSNIMLNSNEKNMDINKSYSEFFFEDFILVLISFIKYFTGLTIKLDISNEFENTLFMFVYGKDEVYEDLAEYLGYELQLKPYAYNYEYVVHDNNTNKHSLASVIRSKPIYQVNSSRYSNTPTKRFVSSSNSQIEGFFQKQFYELSFKNQLNFPPYFPFKKEKKNKFRLYSHDDEYDNNENESDFCDEFELSNRKQKGNLVQQKNLFRNIDKLRIIQRTLENVFSFSLLEKNKILEKILYQRNYKSYEHKISLDYLLYHSTMLVLSKSFKNMINIFRNFYGEYISFYFVWSGYYILWLLFPSVLGLIVFSFNSSSDLSFQERDVGKFNSIPLSYYDMGLIIFSIINSIWFILFIKYWKQKEKFYSYLWGTENYVLSEPNDPFFKPNKSVSFLFGKTIQTVSLSSYYYKKIVSYSLLIIMIFIKLGLLYSLIVYIHKNHRKDNIQSYIFYGTITSILNKIMSISYEMLARRLSFWENFEKISEQNNSLALKLILFEFFNAYMPLYYIGFIKPQTDDKCMLDNCFKELEIQLYLILIINFSFNFLEIILPYISYTVNLRKFYFSKTFTSPTLFSIKHQLFSMGYSSLIYEYNQRIISFGFVVAFSVAAPLTPVIVCIYNYLENYFDIIKVTNLYRVENIESCTGIKIYNTIMKTFNYIGIITSVFLVLFSNKHSIRLEKLDDEFFDDLILKLIIFTFIENMLFFTDYLCKFNFQPFCKYYT